MRASVPADHLIAAVARSFVLGTLGGLLLLAVCLLENIANLGYAVLDGGIWALLGLAGSFGLAFGSLGSAIMLTAAALGTSAPIAMRPARSRRERHSPLPRL